MLKLIGNTSDVEAEATSEGEGWIGGTTGDFTVAAPSSCKVRSLPTLETHLEINLEYAN